MLRDTRMAEIFAALRHGFLRQRRNFGAASTRSTNLTLLVWAHSSHSLHNAQMSALVRTCSKVSK
jgi:hypothetical protein